MNRGIQHYKDSILAKEINADKINFFDAKKIPIHLSYCRQMFRSDRQIVAYVASFYQYKNPYEIKPSLANNPFYTLRSPQKMFVIKGLPSYWKILVLILEIGFLFIPNLEAVKEWSRFTVKAEDNEELSISCPTSMHILIVHGGYGNKDHNCWDNFNQYKIALKCNYKEECNFAKVDDGMKTDCPAGVKKYLDLHYYCIIGKNKLQFSLLTSEDKSYNFACPLNTLVYIIDVTYSDVNKTCVIGAKEGISDGCWRNECSFHNMFHDVANFCPHVEKQLLITYVCNEEEYLVVPVFEGTAEVIECPASYIIDVLQATYSCPRKQCQSDDIDIYIKNRCSTLTKCNIEENTFYKVRSGCESDLTQLDIKYRCLQAKETNTFTVFENGLVDLSCFNYNTIKIIHASFGKKTEECGSQLAMEKLQEACNGKRRCCESATSKLLGESSCPENSSQKLRVTYECVPSDSRRVSNEDREKCRRIRFKISSSFGDITSETVKKMDANLILMVGSSLPRLLQMSLESFDGIVDYMKSIPSLEVVPGSQEKRNDSYSSGGKGFTDMISRTQSKYEAITWYTNFIRNRQIIKEAHVDIEYLANLMTETGVYVSSFASLLFDHLLKIAGEIDLSILRFPDIQNPYMMVYRINIIAWRESERVLFYEETEGGLLGLFESIKFRPNEKYLASFSQDMIESATAEAESLFS